MSVCGYKQMCLKRPDASDMLELVLQAVMACLMWEPAIESSSSARTINTPSLSVFSQTLDLGFGSMRQLASFR